MNTMGKLQNILLDLVRPVNSQRIALHRCWRRVLAEDIIAQMDFPPFTRSPLDGYAVIAEDVAQAAPNRPVILRQTACIAAGSTPPHALTSGTTCRIMTGAPLPPGASGVVPLEDTSKQGDTIQILNAKGVVNNVIRRGADFARGEQILARGDVISRGGMGMLAMLGRGKPRVFRRPRVGILATGNEIVTVDSRLSPGKIHDFNSYMLSAQIREAGGYPILLGVTGDDENTIRHHLEQADNCQMILSTGGVAKGDFDLMRKGFDAFGLELLQGLPEVSPGHPFLVGKRSKTLYVGLTGNPAATGITFEQLLRPVILKMAGRNSWSRRSFRCRSTGEPSRVEKPQRLVWAHSSLDTEELLAEPLPLGWNNMLRSAMNANSLISVDSRQHLPGSGDETDVILLS